MPIATFKDRLTEAIFEGLTPKGLPPDVRKRAKRKLEMLDAALEVGELRSPPGNHLEALAGNRQGQYSIRVNDQWRICFRWRDGEAFDVEFIDYH